MSEANPLIKEKDIELDCEVGGDGVIYLTGKGRVTGENLAAFSEWAEVVKKTIREAAERRKDHVFIMTDVTGISHFEKKPVPILRELLAYDKRYATKSAIVGASTMLGLLLDALFTLTGRTNVRRFTSKREALMWLLEPVMKAKSAHADAVSGENTE